MKKTKVEAIALLEANSNARGIVHWEKLESGTGGLRSFGIGLTQLRKLVKQVGSDHDLAAELWRSNVYDAKVLSILIDEPKRMTWRQADEQVKETNVAQLAHVFASCGAPLAKTSFAYELANDWMQSDEPLRRRCGFLLLGELCKKKRVSGMNDDFLLSTITRIRESIHEDEMWVREAMAIALISIGKRNLVLNKAAVEAAEAIGAIEVDYGEDNRCEPPDVITQLTRPHVRKRLHDS